MPFDTTAVVAVRSPGLEVPVIAGDAVQPTLPQPESGTVHELLTHWAAITPRAIAIDDGSVRLTFKELAAIANTRSRAPGQHAAPRPVWVDDSLSPGAQLVDFVGILMAGDAAVMGDPDWSPLQKQKVRSLLATEAAPASTGAAPLPAGSFYVGFTSGSTGLPKGFVRSHRSWVESFSACIQAFGPATSSTILAPGRLAHSLALFGALLGLWTGGGVRLQPQFSAGASLQTLVNGDAQALIATPSQLILMLEHAQRQGPRVVEATRLVMIGGASWPRSRTPDLRALFPNARIVEFYGASETSFVAWVDSCPDLPPTAVGRPFPGVEVRIDACGSDQIDGVIHVRSPMVFTGYVTPEPTTGPGALLRDGEWLSVGDMGHLDAQGMLHLIGRRQRMFVVQGKNLFPEEIEWVLASHPCVAAASVQAVPDALRGARTIAILQLRGPVDRATLLAWCRLHLDGYKAPRQFFACECLPTNANGKTDHAALGQLLTASPRGDPDWRALSWQLEAS
ncbi:MAG: AMP-binding protein [Proteobacteria bacterium]|nr:AMP-binding protein [Pseudomonadota bacterium]